MQHDAFGHCDSATAQVETCSDAAASVLLLSGKVQRVTQLLPAETVTDPAFLVTRSLEDYVTWVDTSKIRAKISKYNNKLDDYDLLQS